VLHDGYAPAAEYFKGAVVRKGVYRKNRRRDPLQAVEQSREVFFLIEGEDDDGEGSFQFSVFSFQFSVFSFSFQFEGGAAYPNVFMSGLSSFSGMRFLSFFTLFYSFLPTGKAGWRNLPPISNLKKPKS
jgi:hypothetical protein